MKKILVFSLMFALVAVNAAVAVAQTTVEVGVGTSLTQDTSGGQNPIVKAKWEMNATKDANGKYLGVDDDMDVPGAQFMPSGAKDVSKRIALCAIVTDPDGLSDVTTAPGAVYADVFYPTDIALGDSHNPLTDQSGLGCGELMQEDKMTQLSKTDGIELFCNRVRYGQTELTTFQSPYTYDEICKADGELPKETAAVFCVEKNLSYEDPSGHYKVWAVGQDKVGLQNVLKNTFEYLPLTAFATDFTSVSYGNVRLGTHKIINGDLTWGASLATIRNIGNTRAAIGIQQNDMGFGKTNGLWNVQYDARIGNEEADWTIYYPDVDYPNGSYTPLKKDLDLSEVNEMDFSILVSKFPPTHDGTSYSGSMTLNATPALHLCCSTGQPGVCQN